MTDTMTWSMLVYGLPGVGKSTLATHAPAPYFLNLENGLKRIACPKSPRLTTYAEVIDELRSFIKSDYKTVVVDTLDKLDEMFAARAVESYNSSNRVQARTVADVPYGRGGDLMVAEWRSFIEILDKIDDAGKNVLLIGHEQITGFKNPADADFDFYTVNVHKKAAPVIIAKMDAVLFAQFETVVKDKDKGRGKASTTGERILRTEQGASWIAKNRFALPDTVPMDAELFTKIV